MNRRNRWYVLVIIMVAGLTLAACSSSDSPEPLELTIEMSEFAFNPEHLEFQVGQEVTLHLKNVGALSHEIMFGREVAMKDGQPFQYRTDMFEAAHVEPVVMMGEGPQTEGEATMPMDDQGNEELSGEEEHGGFMVHMQPGQDESTMTFTVTEDMVGEWEIGCFDQNGVHYNAGMFGSLTVIP
ncbi:cupredoxin domain-containing protein [bacterium]|nr:cupredoxin domain-containing protein [bacterium]